MKVVCLTILHDGAGRGVLFVDHSLVVHGVGGGARPRGRDVVDEHRGRRLGRLPLCVRRFLLLLRRLLLRFLLLDLLLLGFLLIGGLGRRAYGDNARALAGLPRLHDHVHRVHSARHRHRAVLRVDLDLVNTWYKHDQHSKITSLEQMVACLTQCNSTALQCSYLGGQKQPAGPYAYIWRMRYPPSAPSSST
jgi:hypothetical protein